MARPTPLVQRGWATRCALRAMASSASSGGCPRRTVLNRTCMDMPILARTTRAKQVTIMASTMSEKLTQFVTEETAALEDSPNEEIAFRTAAPAVSLEITPNARFAAKLLKILERKGMLSHSEAAEL